MTVLMCSMLVRILNHLSQGRIAKMMKTVRSSTKNVKKLFAVTFDCKRCGRKNNVPNLMYKMTIPESPHLCEGDTLNGKDRDG